MPWEQKSTKCVLCGTRATWTRYSRLCRICYNLDRNNPQKSQVFGQHKYGERTASLTREILEHQYVDEGMSLADLGQQYNCTRQYILKMMKYHGIETRTRQTARNIALSRGKISFTRTDDQGIKSQVVLQKVKINKDFFKSWSPEMAYVLGAIFTDGNLMPGRERDPRYKTPGARLSIAQKEPELLEKISALMNCNAKIYQQVRKGNPICSLQITSEELYDDLIKFGLTPKKSLTLQFPQVPADYLRHFIRGCWDGDGSVYLEKNDLSKPCASFVSGSKQFAVSMLKELCALGLQPRTLHMTTGRSYYFRFSGISCAKLFEVFYDGVSENMYLNRKYEIFKAIADNFLGHSFEQLKNKKPLTRSKRSNALPLYLTRSTLAEMLGISSRQVTSTMKSSLVRSKLRHLSDAKNQETIDMIKRLIIEEGLLKYDTKTT